MAKVAKKGLNGGKVPKNLALLIKEERADADSSSNVLLHKDQLSR